jgi:hypothetical protein
VDQELRRKLVAMHARHHDIGQQQVDRLAVAAYQPYKR